MVTEFQAQVGFYNCLPLFARGRLFGGMRQGIFDFREALAKRLQKKIVLAPEMLVKASVGQAGVLHNGRNRGTSQAFDENAPRGGFDDLLMDLDFVFGSVTHSSL